MSAQEINRKNKLLEVQKGFRSNAYKIIMRMDGWYNMTPGSKHLVDEILHSIFFLGKVIKIYPSPKKIISDDDILQALEEKYPKPFKYYETQLPRRSPFSCVLDMIVLQNSPEHEKDIKQSLQGFIRELKDKALVSSTICISQKSQTENSKRYYGVSMSTNRADPGKIMIAASCLGKWHNYVSGAVMTYYPKKEPKEYFNGTIKVPVNIRCETFSLSDGRVMNPCRSCHNLFGLNATNNRVWDYGNCAEAESLSNLFENENEVRNETRVHEHLAEHRQRAIQVVREELTTVLQMVQFNTWKGEFYNPEAE